MGIYTIYDFFLLASIFVPLFGSFLCLVAREKAREAWAIGITSISFIFSCLLIPQILKGYTFITELVPLETEVFNLTFRFGTIGIVFAITFAFIGTIALIYSTGYIKKEKSEYYFMTTLMIGSLMGVAYANNLILLYIFWELAAFATWRLVGFMRKAESIQAANKTFLMTYLGSSLMLFGFILIYTQTGSLDLDLLRGETLQNANVILTLIFLGMIAKSACLPIYTWPSEAYPAAPSPSSAILSGVVSKIGLLAFARIFLVTFNISWNWIIILGVVSSIIAGGAALIAKDIKKIIAYSSISQIGFILLAFSLFNKIGMEAALFFVIVHAVGKAGLFLGAGIIEAAAGERNINKLGGFIKTAPVAAVGFLFCAISIVGFPPFGGFWAKLWTVHAAVEANHPYIAALAIFSAILTMLYMFRLFNGIFLGEGPKVKIHKVKYKNMMSACVLGLGIISLAIGIFVAQIRQLFSGIF